MRKTIFCDVYGTQVPKEECRRCPVKQDCTKIQLRQFNVRKMMIRRYY